MWRTSEKFSDRLPFCRLPRYLPPIFTAKHSIDIILRADDLAQMTAQLLEPFLDILLQNPFWPKHPKTCTEVPKESSNFYLFRTVSEYCSACVSCVGLSTKQATEPYSQQFTYGVVREGVIAEMYPQISALFPQNFRTQESSEHGFMNDSKL